MGSRTLWLVGGWVFDGTGTDRFRADVELRGSKIVGIHRPEAQRKPSPEDLAADVSGRTLFPGLIDAHSHVGLLDLIHQARLSPAIQAATIFNTLRDSLSQGFTTLRDLGGVDGGLTAAIENGLVEGPRLFPSGSIISQTAGHGDHRSRFSSERHNPSLGSGGLVRPMRIADGVEDVTRAARDQFRHGATQLKVFAGGGQLSEGDPIDAPQYSAAELTAAVQVAEDRNSYVTVHAHTSRSIQRALRAGVRCIEHATIVDPETVQMLVDFGAMVVPTLTVSEVLRRDPESWGIPQSWLESAAELDRAAVESIQMLDAAGVPLGSGSDLIGSNQSQRGWEVTLKARIVGTKKAVHSATQVNARILKVESELGTIEEGKIADLIAYDNDPIADQELFMNAAPAMVIKDGEIIRNLPVESQS